MVDWYRADMDYQALKNIKELKAKELKGSVVREQSLIRRFVENLHGHKEVTRINIPPMSQPINNNPQKPV